MRRSLATGKKVIKWVQTKPFPENEKSPLGVHIREKLGKQKFMKMKVNHISQKFGL